MRGFRGGCRRRYFWNFNGTPFGFNRTMRAMSVGDPDRAMFGLGPCGELQYQLFKRNKQNLG